MGYSQKLPTANLDSWLHGQLDQGADPTRFWYTTSR